MLRGQGWAEFENDIQQLAAGKVECLLDHWRSPGTQSETPEQRNMKHTEYVAFVWACRLLLETPRIIVSQLEEELKDND